MTLTPALRKFALTVHLIASVGWIGAVIAYLGLGIASVRTSDSETIRAAWTAMDVTGWWVITPLAIAALLTGVVMSVGTRWGLFRHYWVVISLGLTLVCTVVLVVHMPSVSAIARLARSADSVQLTRLGGDLLHPGAGLILLLLIAGLNVYKPTGLTPYGWRKQHVSTSGEVRARGAIPLGERMGGMSIVASAANKAGSFACYFAEMWITMMLGMAVFLLVRVFAPVNVSASALTIGMGLFMAAPMAAWMRVRGCSWRECGEMSGLMLAPATAVLVLSALGQPEAQRWFAANQHVLMLLGMLLAMLFRREQYVNGYSFAGWSGAAPGRQKLNA